MEGGREEGRKGGGKERELENKGIFLLKWIKFTIKLSSIILYICIMVSGQYKW